MADSNSIRSGVRKNSNDLVGEKFGRLLILEVVWGGVPRGCKLLCRCDCGTEKLILRNNIVNDRKYKTVSCGCKIYETKPDAVDGTPEFKTWASMLGRCYNENDTNYQRYGGRGVTVCERWRTSFKAFLEDMGKRPDGKSIERKDNGGNYEPGNCCWATPLEQAQNRSNCHYLEVFGERLTIAAWARRTGISKVTIWSRLNKLGWSAEKALTTRPKGK